MAKNIFGVETDPEAREAEDTPAWLRDDEQPTTESPADAAVEGPPEQARDERGRFAPRAEPEAAPDESQPASTPQDVVVQLSQEEFEALQAAQALQVDEVTDAAEGATQEQLAEAAERLYANKYKNVEDLERGYRERSDMWRRALESQRAAEQERQAAIQERAQYEQALRSAIPMIEQAAARERQVRAWAEQYRTENGQYPEGFTPSAPTQGPPAGLSPAQVQQMLDERLAQERANMAAQWQQQQDLTALQSTVQGFYADHPEVEPLGALDTEITDAMAELDNSPAWAGVRNADGSYGVIVDATDRQSIDILYEAVQSPALLEVLKLRPDYFTSEAGLQFARRDAMVLEGRAPLTTEPVTATVPASRVGARAGQQVPFAEAAGGSTPTDQGPDQTDPWERVKAVDTQPAGRKASVFFE